MIEGSKRWPERLFCDLRSMPFSSMRLTSSTIVPRPLMMVLSVQMSSSMSVTFVLFVDANQYQGRERQNASLL